MIWIYYVITYMTSHINAQKEYHVSYSYPVKNCEDGNWYKCDVIRNRLCVKFDNNQQSAQFLCKTGVFKEEFKVCSNFQKNQDFCCGEYEFVRVLKSCGSSCNENTEQVEYKCKCRSDSPCTKTSHRYCQCKGVVNDWTEWGEYGPCSATCNGGTKERSRYRCYTSDTNEITTDCAAEQYEETSTAYCNTFPCDWLEPTETTAPQILSTTTLDIPLGGKSFILPEKDCNLLCSMSPDVSTLNLVKNCGASSEPGKCSSSEVKFAVTCDKAHKCLELDKYQCTVYGDWLIWTEWQSDGAGLLHRYRHRLCDVAVSHLKEEIKECQREVLIETECKDHVSEGTESTTRGVDTEPTSMNSSWIIPLIIAVVCFILLMCCCGTWFCCMRRRRKERKTGVGQNQQTGANGNGDDVFINGQGNVTTGNARTGTTNGLNVMHRIERISEHLYEAISMRGSRLFSRSSTSNDGMNSQWYTNGQDTTTKTSQLFGPVSDKVENEYVSDEDGSNRFPTTLLSTDIPMRNTGNLHVSERDNVLRISVMVTDPDGKEVLTDDELKDDKSQSSKSVLKKTRNTSEDYVAMENDQTRNTAMMPTLTQRKKQWDRVPSPPPPTSRSPKIFNANKTDDVMNKPSNLRQVGTFKAGIMNMLQHVRKGPEDGNNQLTPKYDDVSPDMSMGDDLDGQVYIPSAPGSVCDNISMWSDSTFDSVNYSDCESPESPPEDIQIVSNSKKNKRAKRKPERKSKTSQIDKDATTAPLLTPSNTLAPQVSTATEYLTPNSRRIASVQYLSPRPGNPVNSGKTSKISGQSSPTSGQNHLTPTLMPLNNENETYLHMNEGRSTVKSWLNLGPAPDPNSDDLIYGPNRVDSISSSNDYCTVNDVSQSQLDHMKQLHRQQSLDVKYTTSPSHEYPQTASPSVLPLDAGGYFNVHFPGPPSQRINTIEAQKAAKNVIRAPLMPKHKK
ncbi:uncharacterized protein LOC120338201 [Styela clava]